MIAALLAAALLQSAGAGGTSAVADTTPPAAAADSTPRRVRRVPLTDALLRTAFADAGARDLLAAARAARTRQDTSLRSYDATTYQRISVGLGIRRFGRDRLLYRNEIASRVRWQRGTGAVVDVLGSRQASPAGGRNVRMNVESGGSIGPIPYYPGQETLWFGSDEVQTEINELDGPVHPLANGAEAYYTYARGDSVTLRLGPDRTIRLRELRVRPRQPRWNLSVGSLWFDAENAQLVRAVFRLAVPMEIWDVVDEVDEDEEDPPPGWVKAMINPLRATVNAVTIEYGIEGGGFWLPRLQALDAEVEAAFARVPVRLEQRFQYAAVNGTLDSLPDIPPPPTPEERRARAAADSAWRDSLRAMPPAQRDSARAARIARGDRGSMSINVGGGGPATDSALARRRRAACDTAAVRSRVSTRFEGGLSVLTRTPCDENALVSSAALPPSIYDEGDTAFDARMEQALREAALSLGAQAEWSPQLPTVKYGLGDGLLRYNRIEGLSPAVRVDAALGRGYAARAEARLGTADLEPNGELRLSRSGGDRTYHVAAYRRLAVANDWGAPLGLSGSLSALLFGRDDGFYYRTWGVEVGALGSGAGFAGGDLEWRLFSERHDVAEPETRWALFNRMRATNITAAEGSVTGMGVHYMRTVGLDPERTRWLVDVRGDGGVGSFGYGRLLGDVTVSRPLLANVDGALTLGGGSSIGAVPAQRLFYLGGPFTVRGQDPGAGVGDAYWMARAELGRATVGWRPVVFYDVGWAGSRDAWGDVGRPLSGAGVGLSILDGLLRFDVSRGIHPERQWRFDSYFEARF